MPTMCFGTALVLSCTLLGTGHTTVSKTEELISWQLWEWFCLLQRNTKWVRNGCLPVSQIIYLFQTTEILPHVAYTARKLLCLHIHKGKR